MRRYKRDDDDVVYEFEDRGVKEEYIASNVGYDRKHDCLDLLFLHKTYDTRNGKFNFADKIYCYAEIVDGGKDDIIHIGFDNEIGEDLENELGFAIETWLFAHGYVNEESENPTILYWTRKATSLPPKHDSIRRSSEMNEDEIIVWLDTGTMFLTPVIVKGATKKDFDYDTQDIIELVSSKAEEANADFLTETDIDNLADEDHQSVEETEKALEENGYTYIDRSEFHKPNIYLQLWYCKCGTKDEYPNYDFSKAPIVKYR